MSNFSLYLCDIPSGSVTALMPDFAKLDTSFEFSDVGSITFDYPRNGIGYASLMANSRVEVAVFKNGVEMSDARFRVMSTNGDEVKDDALITFAGPSMLNRFKKAIVYPGDGSTTVATDQTFTTATPGGILKALFDQNAARGVGTVCDEITYSSFTNATDSNGNPWAYQFGTITYTVGVSYLDIIRNMVDNGMIEVRMVGRDFRVYNPEGMGTDRTVGSSPVVLRKGLDYLEAPQTRTAEEIAAVGLIQGDNNVLLQVVDNSVAAAWGRDETFISQGGIADSTTLGVVAASTLERMSQIRAERTRKVQTAQAIFQPYDDYRVSDYVYNDSGAGAGLERLRIRQLTLAVDQSGLVDANLVLNDKFLEREIAIARKVNGILGGASAGGSVAIPNDPPPEVGQDLTTPKAPASASSSSNVVVNENGRAVAQATVVWAPVTQNTDNSTISDLDHYEVQYRTDAATNVVDPSALSPAREDYALTKLFDRRGKGYGWLGGDVGTSVPTAPGEEVFFFADTNIGVADQEGRVTQWSFVHNSSVLIDKNDPSQFDAKWGYANRLTANDAWLQSTIGNWQADANCAVARVTTAGAFFYGTASLQLTASAAGTMTARLAGGASAYAVSAGTRYSVMCMAKSTTTARNVQLAIRWYDASNTLIATSTGPSTAGSTTFTRYTYSAVAPAGAVRAAMTVSFISASSGQTCHVDCMGLMNGDATMQSWNDPQRNKLGGPIDLVCPEAFGGTALAAAGIDQVMYWCDQAVLNGTEIYVFMTRYTPAGAFQNRIDVAIFDSTTLAFKGMAAWTSSEVVLFANTMYKDSTYLYVYGHDTTSPSSARTHYLMRVPLSNILGGTREYATNTSGSWTTTRSSAAVIWTGFAATMGGVRKFADNIFYALITVYGEGTMRYLTAPNIYGPWTDQGSFYTQPEMGSGLVAYFPRYHGNLDDNSGISMSYSVNGTVQGNDSLKNTRYYAPKFFRGQMSAQAALTPSVQWIPDTHIVAAGDNIDYFGGLIPGWNFQARVRAADYNGNKSTWTEAAAVRLVDDTTPPNKPSTPIISAVFKGLRIEWNGLDYQGGPPPGDWEKLEVHLSEVADFKPGVGTLVDVLNTRLGGVSPIQGLEYGHTYYTRFVAIDTRGNRSDPSDTASSGLEQLVDTTEIANKLISGAKIADGTITTRSLTVAAFEPSIIPNGSFEEEATDGAFTLLGYPYGWSQSPWTFGAGYTVSMNTATPISGKKSLTLTAGAATDGGRFQSEIFPVTEGKLLAVSVKVRGSRAVAVANAFEVHVVCGSTEANTGAAPAAGASVWGTSGTISATTGVQTLEMQRIVDTGMKFARVFLTINPANDGSGWAGTFDDVIVAPVGGSAFIADASILNAKIANLAVDNAKIASVSVGKLTAGILSADMTVSARIKTADTGARVELNSSGLQAYDSTGTQTVNIDSSTGSALFTGLLYTGTSGSRIIIRPGLDFPQSTMYFYPSSGNRYAYINAPEFGSPPTAHLGMNTGAFIDEGVTKTSRLFLSPTLLTLETLNSTVGTGANIGGKIYLTTQGSGTSLWSHYIGGDTQTGGFVSIDQAGAVMSRKGSGVTNGGRFQALGQAAVVGVYNSGALAAEIYLEDTEKIYMQGKHVIDDARSGKAIYFSGVWDGVNASGGGVVNYGTTMSTTPTPMITYARNATTQGYSVYCQTQSATSFSLVGPNTTVNYRYWCVRFG